MPSVSQQEVKGIPQPMEEILSEGSFTLASEGLIGTDRRH